MFNNPTLPPLKFVPINYRPTILKHRKMARDQELDRIRGQFRQEMITYYKQNEDQYAGFGIQMQDEGKGQQQIQNYKNLEQFNFEPINETQVRQKQVQHFIQEPETFFQQEYIQPKRLSFDNQNIRYQFYNVRPRYFNQYKLPTISIEGKQKKQRKLQRNMASNISIEGNKKKIQNIAIQTKKDSNFSFYNVSPISVNERKKKLQNREIQTYENDRKQKLQRAIQTYENDRKQKLQRAIQTYENDRKQKLQNMEIQTQEKLQNMAIQAQENLNSSSQNNIASQSIKYGNCTLSFVQNPNQLAIGLMYKADNRSFFSKSCVFIDKDNIEKLIQVIQQMINSQKQYNIVLDGGKYMIISDIYKGKKYIGIRKCVWYRKEPYPTRFGFNLTPDQAYQMIDILKKYYF